MAKRAAAKRPSSPRPDTTGDADAESTNGGRSVARVVAQIGGAASAVAAILGIVFLLQPDLAPKGSPTEKSARLGALKVDQPVTYRQYLQRTNLSGGDYGEAYLRRPGVFVQFDVEIVGYEGAQLPLRWSLYDAEGGQQVGESEATTLRAEAPRDRATWHIWAPLPRRRGPFFLLIQIFEKDDIVPLDRVETEKFPGVTQEEP
jgi:hypothetical protein